MFRVQLTIITECSSTAQMTDTRLGPVITDARCG